MIFGNVSTNFKRKIQSAMKSVYNETVKQCAAERVHVVKKDLARLCKDTAIEVFNGASVENEAWGECMQMKIDPADRVCTFNLTNLHPMATTIQWMGLTSSDVIHAFIKIDGDGRPSTSYFWVAVGMHSPTESKNGNAATFRDAYAAWANAKRSLTANP